MIDREGGEEKNGEANEARGAKRVRGSREGKEFRATNRRVVRQTKRTRRAFTC